MTSIKSNERSNFPELCKSWKWRNNWKVHFPTRRHVKPVIHRRFYLYGGKVSNSVHCIDLYERKLSFPFNMCIQYADGRMCWQVRWWCLLCVQWLMNIRMDFAVIEGRLLRWERKCLYVRRESSGMCVISIKKCFLGLVTIDIRRGGEKERIWGARATRYRRLRSMTILRSVYHKN